MKTRSNQWILFGGSFNPVHAAHVALAQWACAQRARACVVVVPCWRHPFAKSLAPFADRVAMCRAAFTSAPRTSVSDIEATLGDVSYTAQTIRALQTAYPGELPALLLGGDTAEELATWHEAAWIRQHVELIVAPRGGASPIPDISSSQIRARLAAHASIDDLVPAAVAAYIAQHRLYESV